MGVSLADRIHEDALKMVDRADRLRAAADAIPAQGFGTCRQEIFEYAQRCGQMATALRRAAVGLDLATGKGRNRAPLPRRPSNDESVRPSHPVDAARLIAAIAAELDEAPQWLLPALRDPRWLLCPPRSGMRALVRLMQARRPIRFRRCRFAVQLAVTSLWIRFHNIAEQHEEILASPMIQEMIEAIRRHRTVKVARQLHRVIAGHGAPDAMRALTPVLAELTALNALLDINPFNDRGGWNIVIQQRIVREPWLGVSLKWICRLDKGDGAAALDEWTAHTPIRLDGTVVGCMRNIQALGTTGKILVQEVCGSDGVTRYLLLLPGMGIGKPRSDSPQDLVGAFRNVIEDDSPYTRAIEKALVEAGIPSGVDLAIVGHSQGGAAAMNLAQHQDFVSRYRLTHVIAVGSPVDNKVPADPQTWIASITNQHDFVPMLDGQGAGTQSWLHPDWYVVDYSDPTYEFPLCHTAAKYADSIEFDLPHVSADLDFQLTSYRGQVLRNLVFQLRDS